MAGELVTADWHVELRGLLHGPGTAYVVDRSRGAIKGLGVPPPKTADVELDQAAGSYGGGDLPGVRVVTCAFLIKAASATAAMNALSAMNTAWASSDVAIPLYMRLAGWGKFHVDGHPRGVDDDITRVELGIIAVLARFDALTPTILTP